MPYLRDKDREKEHSLSFALLVKHIFRADGNIDILVKSNLRKGNKSTKS